MIGAADLTQARATAEATLTATVTVATSAAPTVSTTTGKITAGAATTIYSGPASLSADTKASTNVEGDQALAHTSWVLRVPATAPALPAGAKVTVTDPGPDGDATTPATLWVVASQARTIEVLRRVTCTTIAPGTTAVL